MHFEKLKDNPGKDYIYISALLRDLENHNPYVSQNEVVKLFKSVELDRNGVLFFDEYVEMMIKLEVDTAETLIKQYNIFNTENNDDHEINTK